METITVDSSACVRCGLCVRDCPNGVLALPTDGQVPHCVAPGCISCAHCVCVCPTGALKLKGLKDESVVAKSASPASREQVAALVRERRSVRQFRPEPLPHSVIRDLLATSCAAPTGGNIRDIKYIVVEKPELLSEMRSLDAMKMMAAVDPILKPAIGAIVASMEEGRRDEVLRGAPQLLVAHTTSVLHSTAMADIGLAAALETAELAAVAMGVGTCWAGFIILGYNISPAMQEMFARLGVPKGSRVQALMIGKPAVQYPRSVVREAPEIVFH
eukprot:m51a1_g406 hypothetical protein (273) ;mRNA; f:734985-736239